jgi:hypothetical protein
LLVAAAALSGHAGVIGEASGTGPWPAVAELVDTLPTHTIYRPATLPRVALPLFVWGNGACRDNGLAHGAFLRQIASQGYVIVALGRPREERPFNPSPPPESPAIAPGQPPPRNTPDETQSAQMLEAIDWATRENAREGGAFQGHIDVSHIAVGGHSCGGLQALVVSDDPRIDNAGSQQWHLRAARGQPKRRAGREIAACETAWPDAVPHGGTRGHRASERER